MSTDPEENCLKLFIIIRLSLHNVSKSHHFAQAFSTNLKFKQFLLLEFKFQKLFLIGLISILLFMEVELIQNLFNSILNLILIMVWLLGLVGG